MTAYAIWTERERLVVATDTLNYAVDVSGTAPLGWATKVLCLPHARCVIFARGQQEISAQAALACCIRPVVNGIEGVAELLPDLLCEITANYADTYGVDNWLDTAIAEITLAGWSDAEKTMRVWQYANYEQYVPKHVTETFMGRLLCEPELIKGYGVPRSGSLDQQMIAMIKSAGRMFHDEAVQAGDARFGARVGGEVIATQISPAAISTRILCKLEDFAETRNASAAVMGRLERGDWMPDVANGLMPMDQTTDGMVPAAAAPTADVQPLNRQQRRAAERAARKGGARAA